LLTVNLRIPKNTYVCIRRLDDTVQAQHHGKRAKYGYIGIVPHVSPFEDMSASLHLDINQSFWHKYAIWHTALSINYPRLHPPRGAGAISLDALSIAIAPGEMSGIRVGE
jgi:hypothetical protein